MNALSILSNENVASIRDIQKNPSKALRGVTRVMCGSKTIGFFLSNEEFAELVENQEAAASKLFVRRIAKARRDLKGGKKRAHKQDSVHCQLSLFSLHFPHARVFPVGKNRPGTDHQ